MRLIDADALINTLNEGKINFNADINYIILNAPTVEAENVVRCKDCNFCGEIDENGWHCCENLGVGMPKNGFCSDAERKEVEE